MSENTKFKKNGEPALKRGRKAKKGGSKWLEENQKVEIKKANSELESNKINILAISSENEPAKRKASQITSGIVWKNNNENNNKLSIQFSNNIVPCSSDKASLISNFEQQSSDSEKENRRESNQNSKTSSGIQPSQLKRKTRLVQHRKEYNEEEDENEWMPIDDDEENSDFVDTKKNKTKSG
jgi:hypothetical protein